MSEFDVRKANQEEYTNIRFSQEEVHGTTAAYQLVKWDYEGIMIQDSDYDKIKTRGFVVIVDKNHALNLIKAIEKAIELRWLM
jgi:hypothetical protein